MKIFHMAIELACTKTALEIHQRDVTPKIWVKHTQGSKKTSQGIFLQCFAKISAMAWQ